MRSFTGKTILVTGAHGFLGTYVRRLLSMTKCRLITPTHQDHDLRIQREVAILFTRTQPDLVIHLAGEVGGIGANRANPGTFFYDNAAMGIEIIHQCQRHRVEKLVIVGTVCSYPKITPIPFRETSLWDGYPEETNAPYGLAKRMLLVQAQAYRRQYNLRSAFLIPANLYGPGDSTDPETSHVIPALIRKFLTRSLDTEPATLWGTGRPSREFLYVEDCARAILAAALRYDGSEPVNLGTGREIRIRDLAQLIRRLSGSKRPILWDHTRPDGQPRRCLDTTRARKEFGWKATTSLEAGLRKTIRWYEGQPD